MATTGRKLTVGIVVVLAVAATTAAVAGSTGTSGADQEAQVRNAELAELAHVGWAGPSDDSNSRAARKLAQANLATAAYQDVQVAVSDGWASTLGPGEGSLGCFEDPDRGGMGVHYLNGSLLDDIVDVAAPEALVYELDSEGNVAGLVALEYIVPVDAWTKNSPPKLFGQHFHQHSVLPLWILHAWVWKDNPSGLFKDYNPKVRLCPDGVPVFGEE